MKFTSKEQSIIDQANAIIDSKIQSGASITSPQVAKELFRTMIAPLEHEVFLVAFLNNQNIIISVETMFRGAIDGASVYPREVAKVALAHNAAAVILAHNHPSGITEPSQADMNITRRLQAALELFDIRVLDHLIYGAGPTCSLGERGVL